jgi:hypothetical protein
MEEKLPLPLKIKKIVAFAKFSIGNLKNTLIKCTVRNRET